MFHSLHLTARVLRQPQRQALPPPSTHELFAAIAHGDRPAFAALLEGLDIDQATRDASGNTPLHLAVRSGDVAMVAAFVHSRHGRDPAIVQARDAQGETALWNAARDGQAAMLAPLVAAGAQINARGHRGETPLTAAVMSGRLDMVQALIAAGADVNADNDVACAGRSRHNTPLMLAMRAANPEMVRALIAAGADVNAHNDNLDSPLTLVQGHAVGLATAKPMADALWAVIQAGANLMVRHQDGFEDTALAYLAVQFPRLGTLLQAAPHCDASACQRLNALVDAAEGGDLPRVRALLGAVADIDARVASGATALGGAARYGNAQVVAALLEAGANPDATDGFGRTPLMLAARNSQPDTGSEQVVQALLRAGADIDAHDRNGDTALMPDGVFSHWTRPTALALLSAGANVDARNYRGETPLLAALRVGETGLAQWLLEWRADINLACHRGWTALMYVVKRRGELAPWMAAGADVHARNDRGQTALFMAGTSRHALAVAALVKLGADVNAQDHDGRTPLMAAAHGGCLETARAMLDAGADMHAKDQAGVTVLMHAVDHGRDDFVQLLLRRMARAAASRWVAHPLVEDGRCAADDAGLQAVRAALEARDFLHNTALLHAVGVQAGAWPVLALLIDAGADINAQNTAGMTPLMLLVQSSSHLVARLLACGGIDVQAMDAMGRTALMHAAIHGHHIALDWLLDRGADINARDKRGATALIHASIAGQLPVVMALLARNPDIHIADGNLHTAVLHAALRRHHRVVAALEAYGALAYASRRTAAG